jgi:hypothetical protein
MLAVGTAVIIAVIGVVWRKVRWPALVVAMITLALAIPHLDLLFIEAFPTSFYTSPTGFAATAIVHGAKLFAANCVVCHGAEGRGDGPSAKSLPWPPADLTAEHFWAHTDGELFWYLSHGFDAPVPATESAPRKVERPRLAISYARYAVGSDLTQPHVHGRNYKPATAPFRFRTPAGSFVRKSVALHRGRTSGGSLRRGGGRR